MNDRMIGAAFLAGGFTAGAILLLVGMRGLVSGSTFAAAAREALGISALAGAATFGTTIAATSLTRACPRLRKG